MKMTAALIADPHRLEFAPPPTRGVLRALGLAIIAHALLLAALTWGVNWKNDSVTLTAEAELWSALPQAAAPKLIEAPPPPPEPVAKAPPPPEVAPQQADADITLERDKQRQLKEKQEEADRLALDKKRLEQKKEKQEQQKKLEAQREREKQDKLNAALEERKKADQKLAQAKQAELADAKKREELRQENIKRMAGLAGATGAATATGSAQQATGPSPGYAGRIRGRIKPNIVFTEDIVGNPTARVEVTVSADGTITSRKIIASSGSPAWDEAVLRAIDRTAVLPKDVDGRVPPSMEISFRPKD